MNVKYIPLFASLLALAALADNDLAGALEQAKSVAASVPAPPPASFEDVAAEPTGEDAVPVTAAEPDEEDTSAPTDPVAETPVAEATEEQADTEESTSDGNPPAEDEPQGNDTETPDDATDAQSNDQTSSTTYDEVEFVEDSAIAAKETKVSGTLDKGIESLVDIECDEATLADILRQFRKATGANIISDDSTNLQKRVSVSLKSVPWLQGMTAILGSRGFRIDERENIFRVVEDVQLIPVTTRTFTLNHASAKELAELFNVTYGKKDAKGTVTQPVATSFDGANVVVVTATDKIITDCDAIIRAVDKAVPQIYIEARFMELSSTALHKLGVQWDSLESWGVTARNMSMSLGYGNDHTTSETHNRSGSRSSSGSTVTGADDVYETGASITRDFASARSKDKSYSRAFTGQLSVSDFSLLMSAFEKLNDGRIFSNPKVIVSNGKEAKVDMTTKYPNVELTSQRNNTSGTSYVDFTAKLQTIPGETGTGLFAGSAFFTWGITLSVKPRISPDGLISVEIEPAISQLDKDVTSTGFYQIEGGSDTGFASYPIISMKSIKTDFTMKDGCTAVIGGLSRTTEEEIDSGIPYLKDIPWIGKWLFGWKSRVKAQKEIIVFVTVGIAHPDALPVDVGLPKNAILGREYVRGDRLEPGDRPGTIAEIMTLDKTLLQKRAKPPKKGSVSITPAKKPEAVHPVAAETSAVETTTEDVKAEEVTPVQPSTDQAPAVEVESEATEEGPPAADAA